VHNDPPLSDVPGLDFNIPTENPRKTHKFSNHMAYCPGNTKLPIL
jgi:hypothetical protein